jgi:hypothetical protein
MRSHAYRILPSPLIVASGALGAQTQSAPISYPAAARVTQVNV